MVARMSRASSRSFSHPSCRVNTLTGWTRLFSTGSSCPHPSAPCQHHQIHSRVLFNAGDSFSLAALQVIDVPDLLVLSLLPTCNWVDAWF